MAVRLWSAWSGGTLWGLALVGGAASLGIAALCARVVRLVALDDRLLPLLAFVSVAFLPVHLYSSTDIGNELTAAFLGTLGFVDTRSIQ